jgi:hypothetical protein
MLSLSEKRNCGVLMHYPHPMVIVLPQPFNDMGHPFPSIWWGSTLRFILTVWQEKFAHTTLRGRCCLHPATLCSLFSRNISSLSKFHVW